MRTGRVIWQAGRNRGVLDSDIKDYTISTRKWFHKNSSLMISFRNRCALSMVNFKRQHFVDICDPFEVPVLQVEFL